MKSFPPKGFAAINLFGFIIGHKEYGTLSATQINHERIHTYQIREMLWVFFYIAYGVEWLFRLTQYKDFMKAYYNVSFEREAYANDKDLKYLENRKLYSSLQYLKKTT